ncbi:hypothetical protein BGW42_007299, partial [Actinomortierella wolfii]
MLTQVEREAEAKRAILRGMLTGETYERYAWRLERVIRIYMICQSNSHALFVELLKTTIPPDVFNTMNV